MKKIYISWLGILGFIILFMTSCDTDNEGAIYKPTGTEAYFTNKTIVHEMSGDESNFNIIVNRGYFPGEKAVEITAIDTSGLFTIPASVTFLNTSDTASLSIGIKDKLELGTKYGIQLAINEEDASITQNGVTKIEVVKYVWESLGKGIYSSDFFGSQWEQEVLKAKNTRTYRLPDCYKRGYAITFTLDENGEVNEFADQPTGYMHPSYGMVYVELVAQQRMRNIIALGLNFYCSAGSFGATWETIELPQ